MKNAKQKVLFIGLLGTIFISVLFFLSRTDCYRGYWCQTIFDVFSNDNFSVLFLTIPIFILSIITYKMREEVFRAWLRFAYWWIPLSILLTLMTSDSSGGWGIPSLISQEIVAITFSSLFAIISIILIAWKYFATRQAWSGN